MSQFINKLLVPCAFVVGPFSQLYIHSFNFGLQIGNMFECLFGFLHHRSAFVVNHMLRQIANSKVFRNGYTPTGWGLFS